MKNLKDEPHLIFHNIDLNLIIWRKT